MFFRLGKNEFCFYRSFYGVSLLPQTFSRKTKYGFDFYISWLGGCIGWSRIRKEDKVNSRISQS